MRDPLDSVEFLGTFLLTVGSFAAYDTYNRTGNAIVPAIVSGFLRVRDEVMM